MAAREIANINKELEWNIFTLHKNLAIDIHLFDKLKKVNNTIYQIGDFCLPLNIRSLENIPYNRLLYINRHDLFIHSQPNLWNLFVKR